MSRRPLLLTALGAAVVVPAVLFGSTANTGATAHVNAARTSAAALGTSANWSGYAATLADTTFRDVTGTWKVPTAKCTAGGTSSAAIWVGLGGYNVGSQALEQTGTSSDCSASGKATYYVWYELVPAGSVTVKTLKVNPKDVVTASVVVDGTNVLVQVKNRTRRTSFTKQLPMTTPDVTSAEWIAEAPSECSFRCQVVPLTNFGSVTFTNVAAQGVGIDGVPIGGTLTVNPGWTIDSIQLVPSARRYFGDPAAGTGSTGARATPTEPSTDGKSFTVNYVDTTTTAT